MATYWSKIAFFIPPLLHSTPLLGESPTECCLTVSYCKPVSSVATDGEKQFDKYLCRAVLTEYQRVTHRRTDRPTDKHLGTA